MEVDIEKAPFKIKRLKIQTTIIVPPCGEEENSFIARLKQLEDGLE